MNEFDFDLLIDRYIDFIIFSMQDSCRSTEFTKDNMQNNVMP